MCTPSRASLLTGRYPHGAGVTRLSTMLPEGQPTVASQLSLAGYWTGVVGKMHFNQPGRPGLHGFDLCKTEDIVTTEWLAERGAPATFPEGSTRPAWRPFATPAATWLNASKLPVPRTDAEARSTWIVEEAGRQLLLHRDEPFALWVSFQEPHAPFDFPLEDQEAFVSQNVTVPPVGPHDGPQIPRIFESLSETEKRGIIAAYHTSLAFLDRNVGRLLDKLEAEGLAENTLVIYCADHGYSLGHHGRFEKHTHFEEVMRVPLLIRWPEAATPRVVDALVELVDLPATILDLLGAAALPHADGRSLRPFLAGAGGPEREAIFSEYLENEEACIRTTRWKYIHCRGQRPRSDGYAPAEPPKGRTITLFDLVADPCEFRNVATRHPDVVAACAAVLLARFRDTHPAAADEPATLSVFDAIDWYLVPRDGPQVPRGPIPNHPL